MLEVRPGFWDFSDRRNELRDIPRTVQFFHDSSRFPADPGWDLSRDVVTTRVQLKPSRSSSINNCFFLQDKQEMELAFSVRCAYVNVRVRVRVVGARVC